MKELTGSSRKKRGRKDGSEGKENERRRFEERGRLVTNEELIKT